MNVVLIGDCLPFASGWKGSSAPTGEPGICYQAKGFFPSYSECGFERLVAPVAAVRPKTSGINYAEPTKQPIGQLRVEFWLILFGGGHVEGLGVPCLNE